MKVAHTRKKVLDGIMVASLAVAGLLHAQGTHTLQPGDSIADAVTAAAADDTIELLPGVYTLAASLNVNKRVTIKGSTGDAEDVVIDGADLYNITLAANTGVNAVVRDLTIRNGRAVNGGGISMSAANSRLDNCIVTNCTSTAASGNAGGGGVYVSGANAVVTNCLIVDNRALRPGGGVFVNSGANAVFTDCDIVGNKGSDGSGMYVNGVGTVISGCSIVGNGNAGLGNGGGVFLSVASRLVDSRVEGNVASYGGGLHMNTGSAVDRCVIQGNTAGTGGGIRIQSGGATVLNSLIVSNRTGGGVYSAALCTVENCTIAGNYVTGQGGGINLTTAATSGTFRNLIVTGNTSGNANVLTRDFYRPDTRVQIVNSYIGVGLENYANTSGILTAADNGDPKFWDDTKGNPLLNDYRLSPASPCVGKGAYQDWMTNALDRAGNPRLNLDDSVDMGCYAHRSPGKLAVSFEADFSPVVGSTVVTFTPKADGDLTGLQIDWTFGDGSTATTTDSNPFTHPYASGVYTVTATASNGSSETDTYTRVLRILPDMDVYVSPDGSNVYPYISETTAAKSIHDALAVLEQINAIKGHSARTLWVCPGTNSLTGQLVIRNTFEIRGTGAREDCIIDGANVSTRNIQLAATATGAAVRDLTMQRGSSSNGGGLDVLAPNVTIDNCIVRNCTGASSEGGIRVQSTALKAVITNCLITANFGGSVGGVLLSPESLLVDSQVIENRATNSGGGIQMQNALAVVDRCVIAGNTAGQTGGGVRVQNSGGVIRNSLIVSNQANRANSGDGGGGIYATHTAAITVEVENCTIVGNHTAGVGGGLCLFVGRTFRNLIVTGNTSGAGTGTEQDVWRAPAPVTGTNLSITNSYIGAGLNGGIAGAVDAGILTFAQDGPPLFKDDTNSDYRLNNYRLKRQSPCVNAGTTNSLAWLPGALDLDRNPRLYYKNGEIDMGAYQNQEDLIRPTVMLVK